MYCDRCAVEHREGVKGGRVVRVTWEPLQRTMDLCGSCRVALQKALDAFEQGWPPQTASGGRASAPNPQPPPLPAVEGKDSDSDPSTVLTKRDGETWDAYAHRLEYRIKAQRDHLKSVTALIKGKGNRADRKKVERLKSALALVTEKWSREREARIALVRTVSEMGPVVVAASDLWDVLMDAIADGGDQDPASRDAPYLIATTRFHEPHDRLHEALRPFRKPEPDGF